MNTSDIEIKRIFKRGIETFIDVAVKEHQEKLLKGVPDQLRAATGLTCSLLCHDCNFRNLKPLHSRYKCPSKSQCPCRSNSGCKRPCPESICDHMLEGIIKDHSKASPYLKTTDIGKWREQSWEIALCYMKHKSKSVKEAKLLDLLHLMANNKFIQTKLQVKRNTSSHGLKQNEGGKYSVSSLIYKCINAVAKDSLNSLDEIMELLSVINDENSIIAQNKITKVICNSQQISSNVEYVSPNHDQDAPIFDKRIKYVIDEYVQMLWNENGKKKKKEKDKRVALPFASFFKQNLTITGKNGSTTYSNVVSAIFDEAYRGRFFTAISQEDNTDKAQWSAKQSCIFSILECQLRLSQTDIEESQNRNIKRFSGIYILSKSFATKMSLQLEDLSKHVRDFVLPNQQNCLLIIESNSNMSIFDYLGENPNTHTIVYFPDDFRRHGNELKNLKCSKHLMQLNTVSGLVVTSITKKPTKEKTLRRYLQSCGIKIGFENLKDLTFKFINLDTSLSSSNVIVNKFTSLHSILIKKCNFIPVLGPSVLNIEVEMPDFLLSSVVYYLVPLTYQVLQNCPKFKTIKVHEIRVGNKGFCFWFNRPSIEKTIRYLSDYPFHFGYETAKYLVDVEMSKVLAVANCDLDDFKTINDDNERTIFLKCLALSLKLNDDSLIDVYTAKHKDKCSEDFEIVFVCYMKNNFDLSKEHAKNNYKGFSTYYRSHDLVSPESAKAEDSIPIDKWKEVDKQTMTNIGSVIKACTNSLMERHSNLEAISISLGKAKNEMLDTSSGPCIVLFVRLKSFIPYNEEEFPAELSNPDCPDIKFTVDVREGFYTPVAENRCEHVPSGKLVMGCSIGCVGYDYSASLGPFVQWKTENGDQKNGFLTVCHVFCLPVDTSHYYELPDVIQPASVDESDDFRDVRSGESLHGNECGRVAAVEFNEAVDAAVVEITASHRLPNDGAFIICSSGQLKDAGLRSRPKYVNGSKVQPDQCVGKIVIKVGKETMMKAGQILHDDGVVRLTSCQLKTNCARTGNKTSIEMKNQIVVRGLVDKPAFCDLGDSGAGVFLVNADQSLSCVGILIGILKDGSTLVTPINQVLEMLSSKLKSQLCLRSFLPDTSSH